MFKLTQFKNSCKDILIEEQPNINCSKLPKLSIIFRTVVFLYCGGKYSDFHKFIVLKPSEIMPR